MPLGDTTGRDRELIGDTGSGTGGNVSSGTYQSNIGGQVQKSAAFGSGATNTSNTTQLIDGICEGPIQGWPTSEQMKHVYLDGTPVKSYNNTINVGNLRFEFKNGTTDQSPLSQYTIIGAVKSPNWLNEIDDVNKPGGNGAIIQQVQIRDDTDGAYPPVEAVAFTFTFPEGLFRYQTSGGRDNTPCRIKIELNNKADGSGNWYTKVDDLWNQEITGGDFEVTYIVELPPGWATAAALQEYSTPNFADDIVQFRISKLDSDLTGPGGTPNERAHNKLYLKNYSIYTRNQFSFPYTALAGLTIDSRNFDGSVPSRMYDLKLLKVKVPSNYYTVTDAKTGKIIERNYRGTWDGTFKSTTEWTDNPAWCFYDLITNERYGLGKYIDPSLINKWTLYEIAKYCDAAEADTRGTYPADVSTILWTGTNLSGQAIPANSFSFSVRSSLGGVSSGAGISAVKEPRFTCNLLIKDREEAYSIVQRMASLFRGIVYFQHGQVKIIQDKKATPTYAFNNTNVIDGTFAYSSSSAKARHTVAIVRWLDPDDLYSEKLEYVEDYDGMARYGYREIEIDGFGCTSKGQARRIGRHILLTEKFELETVSFKTGMEGATVAVGSLIKIKDSMRQLKRAGGRIVSATSNTITVDSTINIPSNVSLATVKLWVELPYASQDLLADGTYSNENLKPTLNSYSLSGIAAGGNYTTFTLSSGTFTYNVNGVATTVVPSAGNIWLISYDTTAEAENPSVYKVLSVVENNSYEYEITALQSYQDKYDAIETYSPLPEYKPASYKLHVPTPTEGWFTFEPSTTPSIRRVRITWRLDRNISGTKYRVAVRPGLGNLIILADGILDTNYVYSTSLRGNYYFYIYTLDSNSKQVSSPLIIGPVSIKEVLPQNNFDTFSQTYFTSNSITNSWEDDQYPNDSMAYELWRNTTNSLRTLSAAGTGKTISNINATTKTITLNNFDKATFTDPADTYRVETMLFPYIRYKTTNINKYGIVANTSTTLIVLSTIQKPDVSIGDKIFNATRSNNPTTSDNPKATNVTAVSFSNPTKGVWISQITVSPAVTSQTTNDTIYIYKGVAGVGLTEVQPSAAIKQKVFKSLTSTSTTQIVGPTGVFANILVGDVIVNRTRNTSRTVVTKVDNQTITVSSVTSQAVGDIIAFYQYPVREPRFLAKSKIDYLFPAYGGDAVILKEIFDPNLLSKSTDMILINLTRSKASHVVSASSSTIGVQLNYWPAITNAADNDEVILLKRDEVFLNRINSHIHPTIGVCTTGTTTGVVVVSTAGLFTSTVAGDILVNATRNTSAIIATVNSSTQVTLVGNALSDFIINGQTSGDHVFVISASSIANTSTGFNEKLSYNYPNIYTNTSVSTTVVTATNIVSDTGATNSYILYNATRNAYSAISSVTSPSTINLTTAITGQTNGDQVYVFLPSEMSTTVVTAPDGAFKHARPGDIFWNRTRNLTSTILDVVALKGAIDKKLDRLVLNSPIAGQIAGDEFIISQGYYSGTPTAFTDNGSNDTITLTNVGWLNIGDTVNIYKMNATKIGRTSGTTIVDSGLTTNTTYYYWMRVLNSKFSFITGPWKPTDTTGDPATTLPLDLGNYSTSNDNNGTAITIPITGSTIIGSRNVNGSYSVNLLWEWLGNPVTIDGFTLYFWTSGSATDDATVFRDEDHTKAQAGYSVPRRVGTTVSACTVTQTSASKTPSTSIGPYALTVTSADVTTDVFTLSAVPTRPIFVNQPVTISGTNTGTALISGYTNPKTYFIHTVVTTTTFKLKETPTSTAVVNVTGTTGATTGLTYTFQDNRVLLSNTSGLVVGQRVVKSSGTGDFVYSATSTGSGLIINYTALAGEIRRVTSITTPGTGYNVGDILSIPANPTGSGGTVRVTSTNGIQGAVTGLIVHTLGSGYAIGVTSGVSLTTVSYAAGPYITSITTNTQVTLSSICPIAGTPTFTGQQAVTVTSSGLTGATINGLAGIKVGDPIRVASLGGLTNLNNSSTSTTVVGTDHYIVTDVNTTSKTATFCPTLTVTGTYTSGGRIVSCKYNYIQNNITSNHFFNAWAQPYRVVNTATNENGVITGDVRMIYNG